MKNIRTQIGGAYIQKFVGKQVLIFWIVCFLVILYTPYANAQLVSNNLNLRAEQEPSQKGILICKREIHLKSGVDPIAFEKWIREYWNQEWLDLIPGFQSYVDKNESDNGKSSYTYYLTSNKKGKNPPSLVQNYEHTDMYREMIYYEPTKHLFDKLFEYIEVNEFYNNGICYEEN